ncbi:MAG: hypothetical protein OK454_06115, partial [Thaumarchaeota archaeon]|nr:hypothetical protein [Nitrososphaerota archaeon]
MPALAPVPNVLRCDFPFTVAEDVSALNRVFVSYTGTAPTDATCVSLATTLSGIWSGEMKVYSVSDVSYVGCTVTDLTSSTSGQGLFATSVEGTYDDTKWPAGVAFLASMKIARRYRGGKPRTYLPVGAYGLMQDAQTWTTTFQGEMQAVLDQIISDISVTSDAGCALGTLVNVSYYEGFVSSQNPITLRWRTIPKQ